MTPYTVSIIIPTLDRPAHLAACLDSIKRTVDLPHEVICVVVDDDAETGHTLDERDDDDDVQVIVQQGRTGYVKAANLGLRAASGTYITILNDDCELLPFTISNAVRFLEAPAHRNTVGQAAFFHDSPVRRNVHQQICIEDTWYYTCHVRGLCYANFGLAQRELYTQLNYLDERFFTYGSDPDFSLKVWHEAKLIVAPVPGALVHHEELDDERGAAQRARQAEDNGKLFEKWGLNPDQ